MTSKPDLKADRASKAAHKRYIGEQRRKLAKAYHSARQEVKFCRTDAERSALLMKLLSAVEGAV